MSKRPRLSEIVNAVSIDIAFGNWITVIFDRLGIETTVVLAAVGNTWKFVPLRSGEVGGHYGDVDLYYLTHKADEVRHLLILAKRRIKYNVALNVAEPMLNKCSDVA